MIIDKVCACLKIWAEIIQVYNSIIITILIDFHRNVTQSYLEYVSFILSKRTRIKSDEAKQ
ncbi:hypothetical protein N8079_01385 [Crocinitomicaceae bacterium]|nr:hypothetical protein [Crocinitomicaceae bacterium]